MPLMLWVKTAAGPNFGPYELGDRAVIAPATVTALGDAVVPSSVPGDFANEPPA